MKNPEGDPRIKYRIQEMGPFFFPQLRKPWLWWAYLLDLEGQPRSYRKEKDAKIFLNMYKRFGKHRTWGRLGRMI